MGTKVDILFIEISACCCSMMPRISHVPVIMVMDSLRGIFSYGKIQCLLSFADTVVITKTDLVCRADVEIFQSKILLVQPNSSIVSFNGLTGNGVLKLKRIINDFEETDETFEKQLCYSDTEFACNDIQVIKNRQKGNQTWPKKASEPSVTG